MSKMKINIHEANLDDLKGLVVSEGTMRSEDLIPKFLNVLKTYAVDKYDAYVKENPEVLDLNGMDDETMGWVVDELFDKLDEIAPEGFYFAAHPDDGACYGFWEVEPDESKKCEATTEDILVKLTELKDVTDAGKVLDDLKKLGFNTIEYGDYASKDKAYAVLKHPNGMYAELDYTWVQDSSGRDSYSPGEVLEYDYFKDKDEYEEIHGYSPNESKKPEACKGSKDDDKKNGKDGKAAESKKSEEVINNLTLPEAKKIYADVHKNHWKKPKFAELMDRCVADEDCGDLIDYLMGVYGTELRDTLSEDDELLRLGFTLVDDWREEHGTNESKKSESISDTIKMNIDYNTFMRLLDSAAFLSADEDYKDALWDYYSEMGEIGDDAIVFFDNLFQYTAWYDVDEMYDNIGERFQDESKSKEECIQDAMDDVDMAIYQYKDHYLVIY